MAAVAEKKKKVPFKGKLKHRGQLPSKRSINLANLGEKPIRLILAVPGIILHIALIPILVMALERAGLALDRK